ncbi:hypothetical protein [Streptomyces sp. NPDC007346]|uniref:hypothetical protein n=1 Tax=Streptomyces sp. NPDC007346 TaxID=3154682 RepID=UPI0034516222
MREWNHPALVHDAFAKQARPAVGERLPGWLLPGVIDDVRASQGALTGRHVEEPTRRFLDLPTEIPA